ncbi:MAG TPA: methylenetetrahydrofolate reductase [Ilumatobacteraceae bacterium]|jgi:methylenetetrahydrofolate reductase (NADPH)
MARISDLLAARRTFSFEFFPPKNEAGWLSLGHAIAQLEDLQPDFVSVTYGAGGSTRTKTRDLVSWVRRQTETTPMAHLTCQGHTRDDIRDILIDYRAEGVENILALGGDPPADVDLPSVSEYRHASELVEDLIDFGAFSVGVAAHPELHPRSPDREDDRKHLAQKLARADFAITQFFFEVDHYVALVDELADLGVTKPVIPGIMPVTNIAQVSRMAQMSGTQVPEWLIERVSKAGDDAAEANRIGADIATELCSALLDVGAPGLHFYTLNRSPTTRAIATSLGLGRAGSDHPR